MSAFPSAATGRPFLLESSLLDRLPEFPRLVGVMPASRLEVRPAPERVSSGVKAIDALTGGLPRGCLTEICGPASSGRTSLLLAALAAATRRGEVCALVDAGDSLAPLSAATAGIDLGRLLWMRCRNGHLQNQNPRRHKDTETFGNICSSPETNNSPAKRSRSFAHYSILEQVLRVTDLLLQSNGFGLIALDLGDISVRAARRIPLASWFRFRRAIEATPTVLLVLEQQPIAGSCSSLLLRLQASGPRLPQKFPAFGSQPSEKSSQFPVLSEKPSHAQLLERLDFTAELGHTRLERKPPHNVSTTLTTQPAWSYPGVWQTAL